jgi:hypothetical protein
MHRSEAGAAERTSASTKGALQKRAGADETSEQRVGSERWHGERSFTKFLTLLR